MTQFITLRKSFARTAWATTTILIAGAYAGSANAEHQLASKPCSQSTPCACTSSTSGEGCVHSDSHCSSCRTKGCLQSSACGHRDQYAGPNDLNVGCERCNPGYAFSLWQDYCHTRRKVMYTPHVRDDCGTTHALDKLSQVRLPKLKMDCGCRHNAFNKLSAIHKPCATSDCSATADCATGTECEATTGCEAGCDAASPSNHLSKDGAHRHLEKVRNKPFVVDGKQRRIGAGSIGSGAIGSGIRQPQPEASAPSSRRTKPVWSKIPKAPSVKKKATKSLDVAKSSVDKKMQTFKTFVNRRFQER